MTDPLEARAIEAAIRAVAHLQPDATDEDLVYVAARAVLAEIMTGAGDAAKLIARADAALDGVTEGPWHATRNSAYWEVNPERECGSDTPFMVADVCASDPGDTTGLQEKNARFIAASRQLVPALRDALAAALTRADAAECHAEALEAERDEAVTALMSLERMATRVSDRGAETGPQWTQLTIGLLAARTVLRKMPAPSEPVRAALTGEPQP